MLAVRPAAVAGSFYPGDAGTLERALARHLAHADQGGVSAPPKMLLVPHAGYVYSGDVAAQAYTLLASGRGRIHRVVLLGPSHRVAFRGLAAPTAAAFETPLGRIAVDQEALARLDALPQVQRSDAPHRQEHSLEVQLPFLQAVLGSGFTLVPLVVGAAGPAEVAEVLEALWGGDETLIVISSDLSHYLPYDEAKARDRATADRILRLQTDLEGDEACGAAPLNGALRVAAAHRLAPRLLDLCNSADTAGSDRQRVVGYGAVAFEEAPPGAAGKDPGDADEAALGAALVSIARDAIARQLGLPGEPLPPHPALDRIGASFVSLHDRGGRLRGCIGRLEATRALGEDVRANACAAAFHDARFEPLTAAEWPGLQVEVTLLEPATPLHAGSEAEALAALRPGIDGVILEWRGRRATFLPQVWDELSAPGDFIDALKRKAGLAADFWAPDLRLYRYRARCYGGPT